MTTKSNRFLKSTQDAEGKKKAMFSPLFLKTFLKWKQ